MLSDNVAIRVEGIAMRDTLFFPTREDIDILPRIRVGKSLIDLIGGYIVNSWNNPAFYQTTGTYVEGHRNNIPRQKRKEIAETMRMDFTNFFREALPYRAVKIVEDGIKKRIEPKDLSQLTDQEYKENFRTVGSEEKGKYLASIKQMAAWVRGDPRGAGSKLDS